MWGGKISVKDYPQGRMTNGGEWEEAQLRCTRAAQRGLLDSAGCSGAKPGAANAQRTAVSYSGLDDLLWLWSSLSLGWQTGSYPELSPVTAPWEVSVEGDMCTQTRTTNTPGCKMWIFQFVYTLCILWYGKMKYCSVQIPVWWEGFRTFQINAVSVTCNLALPDCLQIIVLNIFSVCVQDKPDSFQAKLVFASLAKIVYHSK